MTNVDVGAFALHKPVGHGGMGVIWSGEHRATGLPVAVKVLRSASSPRHVQALEREIRAAARLSHPRIVRVLDTGLLNATAEGLTDGALKAGCPWFAMEMLEGGTLKQRRADLSWDEVRRVLLDLLDALGHAHARGILHRDIKPSNVLFADHRSSRAKLTDFGMVYTPEHDASPVAGGTPTFMAPEQFESSGLAQGPWTDLYSLGCVVWALVSGRPPYTGHGALLYLKHLGADIPPLQSKMAVPGGLEAWVHRLMAKEPGDRYGRAADAARDLLALGVPTTGHLLQAAHEGPEEDSEPTTLLPAGAQRTRSFRSRPSGVQPTVPRDWRQSWRMDPKPLVGAGLGLFGLREVPLIGREAERDALWEALCTATLEQRTVAVGLVGPSGYGKSRLAEWLAVRAHEVGTAEVFVAVHSREGGRHDGLPGLLSRALRADGCAPKDFAKHLDDRLPDVLPRRRRHVASICGPMLASAKVEAVSQAQRHRATTEVVSALSSGRTAVVWLDDLQWGQDTLDWVSDRIESGDLGAAVVLITAHDPAALAQLGPTVRTIEVGPLDATGRQELVEAILPLDPELARQLEDRAAGSPLFTVQLVGDWVARGLLEDTATGFGLSHHEIPLPEDVSRVWDGRIDALLEDHPSWRLSLELAAVVGIDVDRVTWSAACAVADVPAPPALVNRLLAEGLAILGGSAPGAPWRFAHGMLRESLLARSAREGRLASLHDACAIALSPATGPLADQLAQHLVGAGRIDDAVEALRVAAEHHRFSDLTRARQRLLERESLLADAPVQDPRRSEGYRLLAYVERKAENLVEAREWAARALHTAKEPRALAEVHMEISTLEAELADQPASLAHLEAAGQLAEELDDAPLRANIAARMGRHQYDSGDYEAAVATLRSVLAVPSASTGTRIAPRLDLALALGMTGAVAKGLEVLEAGQQEIKAEWSRYGECWVWLVRAKLNRFDGKLEIAERAGEAALAIATELGSQADWVAVDHGLTLCMLGRYGEADARFAAIGSEATDYDAYDAKLGRIAAAIGRRDFDAHAVLVAELETMKAQRSPELVAVLDSVRSVAVEAGRKDVAEWVHRTMRACLEG